MKSALYVSQSRALVLRVESSRWQVGQVFRCDARGVAAFEHWLGAQKRRSLLVVLDMPDDVLVFRELPRLGQWQLWLLTRKLDRSVRLAHRVSGLSTLIDREGTSLLRQFALGEKFVQNQWYPVLSRARNRFWAAYPVALLEEQILLPGCSSGVSLQATAAENKIRHSCFWNGQLYFTRVLDRHHDYKLFRQQLSDTTLYLQEQLGNNHGASLAVDPVQLSAALTEQAVSEPGLSELQSRLFDFVVSHLTGEVKLRRLDRYRLRWCEPAVSRWFARQHLDMNVARGARRRSAKICGMIVAGLLFATEVSMAGVAAWQSRIVQIEINVLRLKLEKINKQQPITAVSAAVMRDYVLLVQSLPDQFLNPAALLQGLASGLVESKQIVLTEIQWSFANTPVMSGAEVTLQRRGRILIKDDDATERAPALIRVSGYVAMDALSISEAYLVCQRFFRRIEAQPDWELVSVERMPFDTATSNAVGTVSNRTDAGQFSLLLKLVNHT